MPLDATANFVRGETDGSTDSIQTTVSVVDASIFPDPATQGEYNVVIWDVADYPRPDQDPDVEILRVTARDTTNDDLTVTRGQEGTSGASHPLGSAVHLSPTAKMFGDIESTFNEFYDDSTQELTADVNNDSIDTEQLNTVDLSAVSEDQALLKGASGDELKTQAVLLASTADLRIEVGEVSFAQVGGNGTDKQTVTFGTAFSATPFVLVGDEDGRGYTHVETHSTTSFDVVFNNETSNTITPNGGGAFSWIAVGDD